MTHCILKKIHQKVLLACLFSLLPLLAVAESNAASWNFKEYLQQVLTENSEIHTQAMEWQIKKSQILHSEGEFEPVLKIQANNTYDFKQTTAEEAFVRANQDTYETKETTLGVIVEQKIVTGAQIKLSSSLTQFKNSLQDESIKGKEYETYAGISINQPLLRNGGLEVTGTSLKVSKIDREIAFQEYRQSIMEILNNASLGYWNLYLAQQKYKIREKSVKITGDLLKDLALRESVGRASQMDLLDAESGLSTRKALLAQADQERTSNQSFFYSNLVQEAPPNDNRLSLVDSLSVGEYPDLNSASKQETLQQNPRYQARKKLLEKENVRLVYVENQRLPQLDLVASYNLNGLDTTVGSSYSNLSGNNFHGWKIGLEFSIPIGEGKDSLGELQVSRIRKQQLLEETKGLEIELINLVDSDLREVEQSHKRLLSLRQSFKSNEKLLKIEYQRQQSGHASIRDVLDRESRLNRSHEALLESEINYYQALMALKLNNGTLLHHFGLEEPPATYNGSAML